MKKREKHLSPQSIRTFLWRENVCEHESFQWKGLTTSWNGEIPAIYLGFLAVQDQLTADEYFRFAVRWQTGMGCAIAGLDSSLLSYYSSINSFLCVFSSLLSILCLFFIAFEIAYSTRYLSLGVREPKISSCQKCHLRSSSPVQNLRWVHNLCVSAFILFLPTITFRYAFSALMASLPFFGVSSYSTTSTCLPLHVETLWDKAYVLTGLTVVLMAFIGMALCYASIYSILTDPTTPSRDEDKHIVLKMLLLIMTDFVCWVPITFIGIILLLLLCKVLYFRSRYCSRLSNHKHKQG